MAPKLGLRPLQAALRSATRTARQQQRCFTQTPRCGTDGVYRELTAMRTATPFIEAFRAEQLRKEGKAPEKKEDEKLTEPVDTTPKRMSDSFHRVVSPQVTIPTRLDRFLTTL